MFRLYVVTNAVNGKVYVGQTTQKVQNRWSAHNFKARHGSQARFHSAIRKYGKASFSVREVAGFATQEAVTEHERLLIELFNSTTRKFGYNVTDGGESGVPNEEVRRAISQRMMGNKHGLGAVRSEEHKRAISESKKGNQYSKGKKFTEEHKAKIAAATARRNAAPENMAFIRQVGINNKGKKRTPEQKAQMSAARTGGKRSEETRAKMAASRRMWWERQSAERSQQVKANMVEGRKLARLSAIESVN